MRRSLTFAFLILFGSAAMAATTKSVSISGQQRTATAMFAGGCFWCMQPSFDQMIGVAATSVGYAGGDKKTATYAQVSTGTTGHIEVIQITYDPKQVTFQKLLKTYLENVDPTDAEGQFADKGSQYRTAIYYNDVAEKSAAEQALKDIAPKFAPTPIAIQILPTKPFYAAEADHQKYYMKNKAHYTAYKYGSGRADYIERTWGEKK